MKRHEWLLKHLSTIGGSSAAAVINRSRFTTPTELFHRMYAAIEHQHVEPIEETPDMRRGAMLEPIAELRFSDRIGKRTVPHAQSEFLYHDAYPWAHALPDCWVVDEREPVELKVPRPQVWHAMTRDGIHDDYQIQVQHTLAVTNAKRGHFAALNPVTMDVLHVAFERDDVFIGLLMDAEREFFERIARGQAPVEHDDVIEFVGAPQAAGDVQQINDRRVERAAEHLREMVELVDEAQALKDSAQQRLLRLVGDDVEAFEIPGVVRCYHRPQAGARQFDAKTALKEFPQLADERFYKRKKASRPFRTYWATRTEEG